MNITNRIGIGFISLFSVAFIWEILARHNFVDSSIFPPPTSILWRLCELLFQDPDFSVHLISSSRRFLIGGLLGATSAVILAYLVKSKDFLQKFIDPWIAVLYPLPKVALVPFFLLTFGLGDLSKIAMIAMGVFFLVYINIYAGFLRLKQSALLDLFRIYQVSSLKTQYEFYGKGVVPDLLIGLKTGAGYGLTLMVVSEYTGGQNGIGYFIWRSWDLFKILDLYSGVIFIGFMGLLINSLFDYAINKISRQYAL